jgi:low affinity Fe/Cu permease
MTPNKNALLVVVAVVVIVVIVLFLAQNIRLTWISLDCRACCLVSPFQIQKRKGDICEGSLPPQKYI